MSDMSDTCSGTSDPQVKMRKDKEVSLPLYLSINTHGVITHQDGQHVAPKKLSRQHTQEAQPRAEGATAIRPVDQL